VCSTSPRYSRKIRKIRLIHKKTFSSHHFIRYFTLINWVLKTTRIIILLLLSRLNLLLLMRFLLLLLLLLKSTKARNFHRFLSLYLQRILRLNHTIILAVTHTIFIIIAIVIIIFYCILITSILNLTNYISFKLTSLNLTILILTL
jgi:hypothetical protein